VLCYGRFVGTEVGVSLVQLIWQSHTGRHGRSRPAGGRATCPANWLGQVWPESAGRVYHSAAI